MDGLEEFLRALSNGKKWKTKDLAEKLGWPEHRVERYCELTSEQDLVHYDPTRRIVRIDQGLRKIILSLDAMPSNSS